MEKLGNHVRSRAVCIALISLIILSQPNPAETTILPPIVKLTPNYIQATVGESAEVQCEATGSAPIYYTWERVDGSRMPPDTYVNDGDGALRFREIEEYHRGEYRCTARNQHGEDEQLLRVYVNDPGTGEPVEITVEITPPSVTGRPGDELRLACHTQPGGSIVWSKAGQPGLPNHVYVSRDTLIISQARREDEGQYVCTVTVRGQRPVTGDAYVYVDDREQPPSRPQQPQLPQTLAPQLQELDQIYNVIQGHDLTVVCVLTAGHGQVQWSKANEELDANVRLHGNTLRIIKAQMENRGDYVCKVESDEGASQVATFIDVERKCCVQCVRTVCV